MMMMEQLLEDAKAVRLRAYAPYSGFMVGAALLGKSGTVYTGCNVENVAFGPTNCAERTAIFHAISCGEREFTAIAVVGGTGETLSACTPCGVCRQVLAEFCDQDLQVYLLDEKGNIVTHILGELLPFGFTATI